ncbi:hypothetical protein SISSUDRAFT_1112218 [Sistotremastrum suecicum HHB10207 ss-3]|uniref:G-patch domain-containing protein n=1 Tax=Sistotremastrum suecicum HHB10207 ss-3 TaxID=1314776 RepID=A0A166HW04_9AGAM|nr:hypothetical protein SISSUDRAFT_1112218 [Sistotremastrum suecicum HHB10207 ss-3]
MHSGQLKRKLADLGIEGNNPKLTESFCLIGTPLPPLEKSKDTGEFVPLWKQEVRDEQGRRRLHGAFTGGFSAGYFNTVGSKEGWAPSTFVSSRSDRASKKQARPEDFMDEEDLEAARDDRKLVDTHEEMDLLGGTQAELGTRGGDVENDSIASALESMIPSAKDSAGSLLLRKMGWKPGQGIGPRITYKQLILQDQQSSSRPFEPPTDVDEDDPANKHLYAPRDTKVLLFQRKDNSFGLGYNPGLNLQQSVDGRTTSVSDNGPNISAGFGLGALNDADDDDVDVYDGGSRGGGRRLAFDEEEKDQDDHIVMGRPGQASQQETLNRRPASSSTFSDGRPLLPGFVLSDKPVSEDTWFPVPEIPKDWTPDPRRVWSQDVKQEGKENVPAKPSFVHPSRRGAFAVTLTADERGAALGEARLPAAPKSVFDYLAPKDRERLQNLATTTSLTTVEVPDDSQVPDEALIPHTDPAVARAALSGFQPFTSNPDKQARYTSYLQSQASPGETALLPLRGQNREEFTHELREFAKSALIFKPSSGALGGRFATASIQDLGSKPKEGLYTPSVDGPREDSSVSETPKEPEEEPKRRAARLGMFGALTRETKPWAPAKLLCKRFGVKGPEVEAPPLMASGVAAEPEWKPDLSAGPPIGALGAGPSEETVAAATASFRSGPTAKKDISNIGLGDDDDQGRDVLEYTRPERDIFKAIFASDDESSEDEAETAPAATAEAAPTPSDLPESVPNNVPASIVPAHPSAAPSSAPLYEPSTSSTLGNTPVDISTFRPTFVSRSDRTKDAPSRKEQKEKDKKESKKKGKGKAILSFETDDLQIVPTRSDSPDKERRKKKRKKEKRDDGKVSEDVPMEDDDMWVEKPPPATVNTTDEPVVPCFPDADLEQDKPTKDPHRGRKRAVDFL